MRLLAVALVALLAACAGTPGQKTPATPMPAATGAVGDLAAYGRELIVHTRKYMPRYVTANMDCSACHLDAGTKVRGGSFEGIAAQFPQWNKRAHRVIELQDRLAECFLYSMNGRPPAYNSREMVAMASYITTLSRGTPIGAASKPGLKFTDFKPLSPDPGHGGQIYMQRCSACHGSSGAGNDVIPPLWGPKSFNNGAGMSKIDRMAGFVRYNMPQNEPGTLSDQEASDVSAFVLQHQRPKFKKSRLIAFPAERAGYF